MLKDEKKKFIDEKRKSIFAFYFDTRAIIDQWKKKTERPLNENENRQTRFLSEKFSRRQKNSANSMNRNDAQTIKNLTIHHGLKVNHRKTRILVEQNLGEESVHHEEKYPENRTNQRGQRKVPCR